MGVEHPESGDETTKVLVLPAGREC